MRSLRETAIELARRLRPDPAYVMATLDDEDESVTIYVDPTAFSADPARMLQLLLGVVEDAKPYHVKFCFQATPTLVPAKSAR